MSSDVKLNLVRNIIPELPDEGTFAQTTLDVLRWGYSNLGAEKFDELLDVIALSQITTYDWSV